MFCIILALSLSMATSARQLPSPRRLVAQRQHMKGVLAQADYNLWAGNDVAHTIPFGAHARRKRKGVKYGAASHEPEIRVQVLGLQNTGTNLMFSTLLANFGSRIALYDGKYHGGSLSRHFHAGLWKHSNIKDLRDHNATALDFMSQDNVFAVMMVRDPISWLQSLRKAPYELRSCVQGRDWLTKACLHKVPAGYKQAPPRTFPNLEAVWDEWTDAYDHASELGLPRALIVKYEDLVLHPKLTLHKLAKYLGLQKPARGWKVLNLASKTHGSSHGRWAATKRINTKKFLQEYVGSELEDACSRLSPRLLREYHYGSCHSARTKPSLALKLGRVAGRKSLEIGRTRLRSLCGAPTMLETSAALSPGAAAIILTAKAEALAWLYQHRDAESDVIKTTSSLTSILKATKDGSYQSARKILNSLNTEDFPETRKLLSLGPPSGFLARTPNTAKPSDNLDKAFEARTILLSVCAKESQVRANIEGRYTDAIYIAKAEALKLSAASSGAPISMIEDLTTMLLGVIDALVAGRSQDALQHLQTHTDHSFSQTRSLLAELSLRRS